MRRPFPDVAGLGGAFAHTVYLISRREFITRVRSRFFIVGTIVFMALLVGYIVLQALVLSRAVTTVKVAFTPDAQAMAQQLRAVTNTDPTVKLLTSSVPDAAAGRAQVRDGTVDALVSGDPTAPVVSVKDTLDPTIAAALNALVKEAALNRALTAGGVDPTSVERAVANANISIALLDPNAQQRGERAVAGIFVAALLYVSLLLYGQIVAASVVEEKANRIIEILLSTVRPRQLLLGKVIGIGLMGFMQLVLLGAAALVAVSRTQVLSVPTIGVEAVLGGLLWFVLGFVFYALLYAAGGSMVSRQEDLGAITTPITMLVLGTYLAFFWVIANPDNPIAALISIIPPFAPVLMPARMATGDAQAWQVLVAAVLTLLAIAGLNLLAARIYTNSVLRVGSRVKFIQAWRGGD
ncbi:MAG TPA: ABC transporter permease [Candidatus Dormibacteraeota bacterium]|nr:ABC transporter permease [Candidatus Dormibacteraeota bacterium]